jgi:apoptosis-inducing factor 3
MEVSRISYCSCQISLNYFQIACFNVKTGDIEDVPAPSGIHSFKTSVSDGKIFVTADPQRTLKTNAARPPKISPEYAAENSESAFSSGKATGVVIIGGGSASFYAIESLRDVCLSVIYTSI